MVEEKSESGEAKREGSRGGLVIGFILIGLGIILLIDNFFPGLGFGKLWPVVVIVWGVAVFVSGLVPPFNAHRLLRGIFIGTVGVILLYNTLGIIPFRLWLDLTTLWPVLLIAAGFAILGGVTRNKIISAFSLIIIIATLVLAFVYHGVLFQERGLTSTKFSREMISGIKSAIAAIDFGVGKFDLSANDMLYNIDAKEPFAKEKPQLSFKRSKSSVQLGIKTPKEGRWNLGSRQRKWMVLLSRDIDWQLEIDTGVSDSYFDLKSLKVSKLDLRGGVGTITVRFGDRRKQTNAAIKAGVSQLRVIVPKSVGVRLKSQ